MFKKIKQKIYNLLLWSQKWTKTDMIYLAGSNFWLNIGQVVSMAAHFAMSIAFANLLDPAVYGTYSFIVSIQGILIIPTLIGINTAIVRAVARGSDGTIKEALKTKLKWGTFSTLAGLGLAGYYFYNQNIELAIAFLVMSPFLPIASSFGLWSAYLRGKKDFKNFTKYNIVSIVVPIIFLIATLFLTNNLIIIVLVNIAANTLFKFILYKLSLKKYPPSENKDPKTIGFGKHLSLMNIIGEVSTWIDRILVFHFLGAVPLAIYAFARAPIKYLKGPLSNLSYTTLPKLSQRSLPELKKSLPGKMFKLFIVILPAVLLYILIAPYFFKLLYPKYIEAVKYSQVFALTLLLFPKILISQTLIAHAKKKYLYLLKITTPLIRIVLFLILIPVYGLWGLMASFLLTETIDFSIMIFLFRKLEK